MHQQLKTTVAEDMPRLKRILSDLVRMPSISAPGFDPSHLRSTADHIVTILVEQGFSNPQLLEAKSGSPAVFAEIPAPGDAPTVLLYAHYDVQPPGPAEAWETGPFEPSERSGRLYGRGAADDKAGVVMHLGAVAAHGDALPVGVQVFIEGEEEAGSVSLEAILEEHSHLLHPDVIVIGDGGNWSVGVPALLTSLRGLAAVSFELRTLKAAVHSGQFGGVYPDALSALARLLASLYDDDGNVAIEGLVSGEPEGLDPSFDSARQLLPEVLPGVAQIGSGSVPGRLWTKPSVSVLALDAPPVGQAINQLVPSARAKVSLRIAPGQDSGDALSKLKDHLLANTPWGAEITFFHEERGEPSTLPTDNFAVEAWGKAFTESFGTDPVHMGAGGSIPFIATFAELFPGAPILVTGCADPTSAFHAPNESVNLADLEKAVLAEAIALSLLAG